MAFAVRGSLMKNFYVITSFLLDYFLVGTKIHYLSFVGAGFIMTSSFVVFYGKSVKEPIKEDL